MVQERRDVPQFDEESLSTALHATERDSGLASRKIAFCVLAVFSVLGCVCAIYFWYLWIVTVQTCYDTYILGKTLPALMTGEANSWQEYFSALDISSFSARILALLFTRLTYSGGKIVLRCVVHERGSFFDRAYHHILFPEGFESLCIRLGLLGTLLSFLLAALSQMSNVSTTPEDSISPTIEQQVARVVEADETNGVERTDESTRRVLTTSRLSEKMFLLLCASLVSTFVGTGVAYVITPSLNWLCERAVGRHQIRELEARVVADEFFRQISRTSERMAEFERTTARLAESASHISSFEASVGMASNQLRSLLGSLENAIKTFEISNRNGQELVTKLESLETQSDRMISLLQRLPDKLNGPLESISIMAARFREAATSGEVAFRELKAVAGPARETLEETKHRTKISWQMLKEIRDGLSDLAANEAQQTNEVVRLVTAFDEIGGSLNKLVAELDSLKNQSGQRGSAASAKLAEGSIQPSGDVERSWWQRLFG